jgi:hypothetical protein
VTARKARHPRITPMRALDHLIAMQYARGRSDGRNETLPASMHIVFESLCNHVRAALVRRRK